MSKKIKTLEQLEELHTEEQQTKLMQLQAQLEDCLKMIDHHQDVFVHQPQTMAHLMGLDHYIQHHQQQLHQLEKEKTRLEKEVQQVRQKLHHHYKKQKQYSWLVNQYDRQQQSEAEKQEQNQVDEHTMRQFQKSSRPSQTI